MMLKRRHVEPDAAASSLDLEGTAPPSASVWTTLPAEEPTAPAKALVNAASSPSEAPAPIMEELPSVAPPPPTRRSDRLLRQRSGATRDPVPPDAVAPTTTSSKGGRSKGQRKTTKKKGSVPASNKKGKEPALPSRSRSLTCLVVARRNEAKKTRTRTRSSLSSRLPGLPPPSPRLLLPSRCRS